MTVEAETAQPMPLDKSIEDVAQESSPQIAVLGIGGGGSNIVSYMHKSPLRARTIAMNSDAQHLTISEADERILLGYHLTGGLGCGGFTDKGIQAAEESALEIEQAIGDAGLVFVTTTLGGGTGTGASPVVARIAREKGALTIGVVTIPFKVEGTRLGKAKEGLKKLVDVCDAVVVIDNNKLRVAAGKLPVREAFAVANERVTSFLNNMTETLSVPGIMNLDFADVKAIMMGAGICAIGFGEGQGGTKVDDAVNKALDSQLLDIGDLDNAEGALVHIEGGEDMTLEDINRAGELVMDKVSPNARVVWGAKVNSDLDGKLKAMVVLAGVESPFLMEREQAVIQKEQPKPKVVKINSKKAVKD